LKTHRSAALTIKPWLPVRERYHTTLAHGAFNAFWSTFTAFTVTTSPLALEYLAGETGTLPLIATAVVAGWVLYRLNRPMRNVRAPVAQTS